MILPIPLQWQVLRLLKGRRTYQEICDRQWVLYPQESCLTPRAIYRSEDLERVTAVHPETTYAYEVGRIQGGKVNHAATTVYQIRQTHIQNGSVYKGAMRHCLAPAQTRFRSVSTTELLDRAALACTFAGLRYFGHFVTDDLTLAMAAESLAQPITMSQRLTTHQLEYRHLFGIDPLPVVQAQCQELLIIDDVGQNRFKRQRYERMRLRLRQLGPSTCEGVMFLRKSSGVRRWLVNETEVAAFLQKQGFVILDAESLSVAEIMRQVLGARLVIGVEGSQLVHGLFAMADGGTLLTLQPPNRFNNVHKDYTDCLGMNYAFVVGNPEANGFSICLEDLAKMLDRLSQAQLV
ncbi:MAG: glycosyltransferase family 61 protein [Leptolyngbya sp. IPPAS B-1204]|nr:glycosyltransferase family 61 protein [Elainella sp. C42_A2020_010]RNJ67865.1 MAG: glycosyltransferase family 61 protein [Leptolyngbya sp. IPPAS B-1204]